MAARLAIAAGASKTSLGTAIALFGRMRLPTYLLALALGAGCTAHASPGYATMHVAPPAPPHARVVVGPAPYPDAVWVEGHYVSRGGSYVWVDGRWIRPRPGYVYVQPRWERRGSGYIYVEPGWAPRGTRRRARGHVTVAPHRTVVRTHRSAVVHPRRTTVRTAPRREHDVRVRTRRDTQVRVDRRDRRRDDRRRDRGRGTTVRVR